MSLPTEPNRSIPSSLRQGDSGWPVYGLQCALSVIGYALAPDGAFGPKTDSATRTFQSDQKLTVDGIAGAATQSRAVTMIDAATHKVHPRLPTGLLRGFSESEGGNNLGAVNWSVAGGVDCGVVQIRVTGPPYAQARMEVAYNPRAAMQEIALTFLIRETVFGAMAYASRQPTAYATRCAALNWNWPYAAEQYARYGKLPEPDKTAEWAKGIKFTDGTPVKTWRDWAEFYAMGGKHGEGRVMRYVQW